MFLFQLALDLYGTPPYSSISIFGRRRGDRWTVWTCLPPRIHWSALGEVRSRFSPPTLTFEWYHRCRPAPCHHLCSFLWDCVGVYGGSVWVLIVVTSRCPQLSTPRCTPSGSRLVTFVAASTLLNRRSDRHLARKRTSEICELISYGLH